MQETAGADEGHEDHSLSQAFDATETISRLKNLGLWSEERIEVVFLPVIAAAPPEQAEAYQQRVRESAEEAKVRYRVIKMLSR